LTQREIFLSSDKRSSGISLAKLNGQAPGSWSIIHRTSDGDIGQMPEEPVQQSPEILRQIQAAERKVERMVRSAEEEASAILDQAREQAEKLVAEKRRSLAERNARLLAEGAGEAERAAKRILQEAGGEADELKSRCASRLDEAAEWVLHRVLPGEHAAISRQPPAGTSEADRCMPTATT
jgi:V-type H+-transporting ATPase subunit G